MELDQALSLSTTLYLRSTAAKAKATLTAEVNKRMMATPMMTTSTGTMEIAITLKLVMMLNTKTMLTTVTTQRTLFEIMNKFYLCQVIFVLALNKYGTFITYHHCEIKMQFSVLFSFH